jgi:replicative DNA helicase
MRFRQGTYDQDDINRLARAYVEIMENENLWIVEERMPVDEFRWVAKTLHSRVGLSLIAVDYLQRYPRPGKMSPVNEVGAVAETLKDIARETNVPVLCAVQLSRAVEGRDNRRPTMADARASGLIEQEADIMLALFREAYYDTNVSLDGSGQTEVIVLKSRDGIRNVKVNLYWSAKELSFKPKLADPDLVTYTKGVSDD